jgi:hypothetical protein
VLVELPSVVHRPSSLASQRRSGSTGSTVTENSGMPGRAASIAVHEVPPLVLFQMRSPA